MTSRVSSSNISPRLLLGRAAADSSLRETKSTSLNVLVRLKEKRCEFCIVKEKEKVGHTGSLFRLWKEQKGR